MINRKHERKYNKNIEELARLIDDLKWEACEEERGCISIEIERLSRLIDLHEDHCG